jgi:hypothetical protein
MAVVLVVFNVLLLSSAAIQGIISATYAVQATQKGKTAAT